MSELHSGTGANIDELAALSRGWTLRTEAGAGRRTLRFDSFDRLSRVLTGERLRMLRRLRVRPAGSVAELAEALHRPLGCVHEDVAALEMAGLIDRSRGVIEAPVDRLSVVAPL